MCDCEVDEREDKDKNKNSQGVKLPQSEKSWLMISSLVNTYILSKKFSLSFFKSLWHKINNVVKL